MKSPRFLASSDSPLAISGWQLVLRFQILDERVQHLTHLNQFLVKPLRTGIVDPAQIMSQ
jgi:hypothetical protein